MLWLYNKNFLFSARTHVRPDFYLVSHKKLPEISWRQSAIFVGTNLNPFFSCVVNQINHAFLRTLELKWPVNDLWCNSSGRHSPNWPDYGYRRLLGWTSEIGSYLTLWTAACSIYTVRFYIVKSSVIAFNKPLVRAVKGDKLLFALLIKLTQDTNRVR